MFQLELKLTGGEQFLIEDHGGVVWLEESLDDIIDLMKDKDLIEAAAYNQHYIAVYTTNPNIKFIKGLSIDKVTCLTEKL